MGLLLWLKSTKFVGEAEDDTDTTSLMVPILKDTVLNGDGEVDKRTFFLADTEAFLDPCCVIPDIGGPSCKYFVVQPRNQWAERFEKWANLPHTLDEMDVLVKPEEESMPQEEGNGGQCGCEDGLVAEYVATVPKKQRK